MSIRKIKILTDVSAEQNLTVNTGSAIFAGTSSPFGGTRNGIYLKNFLDYAKLFGWALALGHARSGDAAMISGYWGESKGLAEALYAFARSYAKQNESDYLEFINAVKTGVLRTES